MLKLTIWRSFGEKKTETDDRGKKVDIWPFLPILAQESVCKLRSHPGHSSTSTHKKDKSNPANSQSQGPQNMSLFESLQLSPAIPASQLNPPSRWIKENLSLSEILTHKIMLCFCSVVIFVCLTDICEHNHHCFMLINFDMLNTKQ